MAQPVFLLGLNTSFMIIHAFNGQKLDELINKHNQKIMDKQRIIKDAFKTLADNTPLNYKITYLNEEQGDPADTETTTNVSSISFHEAIPHDSPAVFNIEPKRAYELKHQIEQYFYDLSPLGDKVRKNIYQVNTALVMQHIVHISESTSELFFLTFELGVLCSPLYH